MIYNKDKLIDLIDRLNNIIEYDYITYPPDDNKKTEEILSNIETQVEFWEQLQNNNFSY
jgi:hypothetical protein